jgi:hypothetical protein
MDRLAAIGPSASKDVFLSLLIGREWLNDKTKIVDGQIQRVALWSTRCYDFAAAPDGPRRRPPTCATSTGW